MTKVSGAIISKVWWFPHASSSNTNLPIDTVEKSDTRDGSYWLSLSALRNSMAAFSWCYSNITFSHSTHEIEWRVGDELQLKVELSEPGMSGPGVGKLLIRISKNFNLSLIRIHTNYAFWVVSSASTRSPATEPKRQDASEWVHGKMAPPPRSKVGPPTLWFCSDVQD